MNKKNLAPIALFVYNRPKHTKQTIEMLCNNELARDSELYIFLDGAKGEQDRGDVDKVRVYINTVKGFKNISVIERERNYGLAESIISGVTQVVEKHGKVIVLEDDLLVSPYFLSFMNESLLMYATEKKVMHISAWNYPIDETGLDSTFLWRNMNCWGWATWSDRWSKFNKDTQKLINQFSKEDIYRFNLDGYTASWAQVLANDKGRRNTWAIFWYASIFKNKGLCLNPTKSLVENIGHDDSGVHSGGYNPYSHSFNQEKVVLTQQPILENKLALSKVQQHLKQTSQSIVARIFYRLRSLYRHKRQRS